MTRERDDEGSVLLLVLGLSVVLMVMVAVVADVSAVVLAKRGLDSAADGAAVAAAQQADVAAVRADGLGERLPLDPDAVEGVVGTYQDDEQQDQPGLQLVVRVDGFDTAVVEARRRVPLPFAAWFGVGAVDVRAEGRARSPVLP